MIQIIGNIIKLRQATKQGFAEIPIGGKSIADLSYPKSELRRGRVQGEPLGSVSPTVTTTGGLYVLESQKELINKLAIRKLTPEECFILMGLTAEDCEKCRNVGVSNSQLYKQAGNGLITNCVQYIMEHLYKTLNDPNYKTIDERMIADGYGV